MSTSITTIQLELYIYIYIYDLIFADSLGGIHGSTISI